MCGICGLFDRNGNSVDRALLESMMAVINHRGPDGDGRYVDSEIGLGHRRLSIIDLGGGAQPISNEDHSLQVVFNGEIYNFIELRKELEGCGHSFRTHSDTEVIVHAYEQWGRDCVSRFNGMFAFALWDSRNRELFIARDHLGIKPLYYTEINNRLLFASEIKALLLDPSCRREVDLESLAELFSFRYVPSPKTLFKGIFKLPPGHYLHCTRSNVVIRRFWNWVPEIDHSWQVEEGVERYRSLLEESVRLQLRSDVPLGLFLSSGIDSGVLLAIMSEFSSGPVQAFTIGFKGGEKTNEVADAKAIASRFGADHHHMMVGADDYESYFVRYMQDLEEPVGHEQSPAFYFLSYITSKHVKVALTGQGADEPWAGYDRYIGVKLSGAYSRLPAFITDGIGPMLAKVPGRMERLKRGLTSLGERDVLTRFAKVYSFFNADMKQRLFTGVMKERFSEAPYATKLALQGLQADVHHLDPLSQMLYIDTRTNLPDDLLMVADKTSMANSLEVRVPFLDYRLIEFIESLPPKLKLRGLTAKYLHKKALEKWLPREDIYRKKKGFENPIADWLRTSMEPLVKDALLSRDSFVATYFDQNYIRQMLDRDKKGLDHYLRHIYLLLSVELWHRAFIRK